MSEPRYIQRDKDGVVIGHYANAQPYAEEMVPEDHPDILAWYTKLDADREAYLLLKATASPDILLAKITELERQNQTLAAEIASIKSARG